MPTPYENIYSRFTRKIYDIKLANMIQESAEEIMFGYMCSAIVRFPESKANLFDKNDTTHQFNPTLTEIEEEVIATLMIVDWVNPYINNIMVLKQTLSDNDFRIYSQSQHLSELQSLKQNMMAEADKLILQYSYSQEEDLGVLR